MQRGDFEEACFRFAASDDYATFCEGARAPGTLLNLSVCSEKLGRVGAATQALEAALRVLPAGDDRRSFALEQLARLAPRVGHVVVRANDLPSDAFVTLDAYHPDSNELPPGDLGVPLAVDPGLHTVVASFRGQPDQRFEVTVRAGETRDVVIVSVVHSEEQPVPTAKPEHGLPSKQPSALSGADSASVSEASRSFWSTRKIIAVGIGGAGIVTMAASGLLGLSAKSKYDSADGYCTGDGCTEPGYSERKSAISTANSATIVLVLGTAAAAAGAVLWFTDPSQPRSVGLAPSVGRESAAVTMVGAW